MRRGVTRTPGTPRKPRTPRTRRVIAAGSLDGRSPERSVRALSFQLGLLLCLLIALLALGTMLVQIVVDGAGRLNGEFFTSLDSRRPGSAGIKPALIGSVWLMGLVAVLAFPIGMGAAIYLEEFAPRNRLTRFIELNIANLAGVPSIIYGLLGLAIFVRQLSLGRSVLAGAMTLALLVLPIVIVASREALRGVPPTIRHAALGVGATQLQTVRHQVLPAAMPGMLTGMILALSRAIGETAPLITLGALTYVNFVPSDPLDRFTALPIQVFNWISRPQAEFQNTAAAGILVLLGLLLLMNGVAILLRNRYEREW